jgi:hypothetical protein
VLKLNFHKGCVEVEFSQRLFCAGQVPAYENEGDAPEGTRLSSALCARLGVPEGTIWGLPAGQRRDAQPAQGSAAPQQSAPPAASASKSLEV